jgi:prevent-host-death family protein
MTSVSVAEAKNRLSELLVRVEAGEEISVTRRGRPVARLVAVDPVDDAHQRRTQVTDALQRLAVLRRGVRLGDDLKAVAREGLD